MSMLLLQLSEKYEVLNLRVEHADHHWTVSVVGRAGDDIDKEAPLQDAEDNFGLLNELMPGALLTDFYGDVIRGASGFECSSFHRSDKTIVYYHGEVYADHIGVSRMQFETAIDFYIYLFSEHPAAQLSATIINEEGLPTPFALLQEAIQSEGYSIEGFKHGGIDDEGYAYYAMLLKSDNNQYDLVQYPQRGALLFNGSEDILPIRDAEPSFFTSDLLKLLKRIKKGEVKTYIENYKY